MTPYPNRARHAAALAAALCLFLPGAGHAAGGNPVLDPEEKALCAQVNTYRAEHGLAPLKVSVSLTKASKWLSADMASHNYLAHTDSLGRTYTRRISAFGYRGSLRSENVAGGSAGAAATLEQWKRSAPHRRNLLRPGLRVIGIGRSYAAASKLGWYWTTAFGAKADRTMPC